MASLKKMKNPEILNILIEIGRNSEETEFIEVPISQKKHNEIMKKLEIKRKPNP